MHDCNKMDLVDYDEAVYERIKRDCTDFMANLANSQFVQKLSHVCPACVREPSFGGNECPADFLMLNAKCGDRSVLARLGWHGVNRAGTGA